MKKLLCASILGIILISEGLFAQSVWEVKALAGVSDAAFLGNFLDGGPSVNADRFREYGVRVSWLGNRKWGLETGFSYAKANLTYRTISIPGGNPPPRPSSPFIENEESFDYISIPFLATYEAASFLSFQAGPLMGFELYENRSWMEQSGIGYLIGINLHHYFDRLGVFIQPNFKQHAAIGFNQTGIRLTEFGLQIGLAYRLTTRGF